jgi:perosamine synthetase
MSMRFRHVAPAGAPIRISDLARWAAVAAVGGDSAEALADRIRGRFAVQHVYLTSTGRAGLTMLLRAMRTLAPPDRREVILSSYTCYSVAAAIVKAGLSPRIVDIAPETLDFDLDRLRHAVSRRALAIVASNLYGLPSDLARITECARSHDVFVIDDAAQALGATVDGVWCGTRGDAGIFSFDKGKNVSAVKGGVLVTNSSRLGAALDQEFAGMARPRVADTIAHIATAVSSSVLLHPSLYWVPNAIPQLGLGRTIYSTEFNVARAGRATASLARVMTNRLDAFTDIRRRNAARILSGLNGVAAIQCITPTPGSTPVYPRLPVLAPDARTRDGLVSALNAAGIGASGSYPESIADIPQLRPLLDGATLDAAGGRDVARRIITLPTHPYVTSADIARMVAILGAGALEAPAPTRQPLDTHVRIGPRQHS